MKRAERMRCLPDRRPEAGGISPEVRLFVYAMERDDFCFEVREDGRGVRVRGPGDRFTD